MYTILDPQPAKLNANESAVRLDDDTLVAIAVSVERPQNNTSLVFSVSARCIGADGADATCPCGDTISTSFSHSASAADVANLTQAVIAREMIKAVLGEPLGTHMVDDCEVPVIHWSPDFLAHASIRNAVTFANASAAIDPATLL